MKEIREFLDIVLFQFKDHTITIVNVLIAIVILVGARLTVFLIKKVLSNRAFLKRGIDEKNRHSIVQLSKYFIYIIAIVAAIEGLGINISILLAGSAALLVGIGLGLQQTFKDLVSGLFILFENNLKAGDVIEVEGVVGRVENLGLRTSEVTTRDGISIIIPNHKFIDENVINWSHNNNRRTRFKVSVGVAYGSDTALVRDILINVAKKHEEVENVPHPLVRFEDFGNSSLDFELFFWSERLWKIEIIRSELRFEIDKQFREKGVKIPFPQRDLHIIK